MLDWAFELEIGKYMHGILCPANFILGNFWLVSWLVTDWLKRACARKWQSKMGRKAPLPQPYVAQVGGGVHLCVTPP